MDPKRRRFAVGGMGRSPERRNKFIRMNRDLRSPSSRSVVSIFFIFPCNSSFSVLFSLSAPIFSFWLQPKSSIARKIYFRATIAIERHSEVYAHRRSLHLIINSFMQMLNDVLLFFHIFFVSQLPKSGSARLIDEI